MFLVHSSVRNVIYHKGLLKRAMSAPALREISSFRNDTLQRGAPAAGDESLDSRNL